MNQYNQADLPYLYEHAAEWVRLPNGLERQLIWAYSITPTYVHADIDEAAQSIILERIDRQQQYRFGVYDISVVLVMEWRYLESAKDYAAAMLGYRSYWEGNIRKDGKFVLQPEVAIALGFSPDFEQIPTFLDGVSLSTLEQLLAQAEMLMEDDDALAFSRPLPIGAPKDAPPHINDALRRMRVQTKLRITRGRAGVLEMIFKKTGVEATSGGWRLNDEEWQRRQKVTE